MLEAISRGDIDAFMEASKHSLQFSFGQMSSDNEKGLEYQCVIGVSLFARAAMEGGVNSVRGYNLNDLFLQRISKCSTYEEYMAVMTDAIETFFQEVHMVQAVTHQSIHLEKAKQYIAGHISQAFTIQDLADHLAINKAYLMRLFRKYENCTVTDYIHNERINVFTSFRKASVSERVNGARYIGLVILPYNPPLSPMSLSTIHVVDDPHITSLKKVDLLAI